MGVLIGIVVLFFYWNVILFSRVLGVAGALSPAIAGWSEVDHLLGIRCFPALEGRIADGREGSQKVRRLKSKVGATAPQRSNFLHSDFRLLDGECAVRMLMVCLTLAFVCTPAAFCADATLPAMPAPGTQPTTITAPPPSEQVKPEPPVPGPLLEVPSPVAPSEPIGPVPHPTPIPDQSGAYIYFSADS